MGKMSAGIWSQQLLFLLPFLIFVVVLSVKPLTEPKFWGETAWIPQPCIIPDGKLSAYKSLLCPPKSIHSPYLPYG